MRGLAARMDGRVLAEVEVRRPDLRWPLPERMGARLTGRRILGLRRRAKYILVDLDDGMSWMIHLGMSGRMLISDGPKPELESHDHVVFRTDDDAVYAVSNTCPHRGGPLSDGIVHGHSVTCPLHNMVFDLATGEAQGADERRLDTFPLRVDQGRLLLDTTAMGRHRGAA